MSKPKRKQSKKQMPKKRVTKATSLGQKILAVLESIGLLRAK